MSVLTLVRHGQASYMQADYDKLSSLGEQQSKRLGEYWVRHRILFDRVFHGPAHRHIRTTEIAGDVVRSAGLPRPEPREIAEFDEFDAFTVMRIATPLIAQADEKVQSLVKEFEAQRQTPEAGRVLQKLFEAVARHWSTGTFETPSVETWAQFRARVSRAIRELRDSAQPSTSTAVVTSGGPIAASMGLVLDLDAAKTVEFVWLSRNCSYTQFLFSRDRISLHAFNAIPHLEDLNLFTYR